MNSNSTHSKSATRVFAIIFLAASWPAWAQQADMQSAPPESMEEMKPVEDAPPPSDPAEAAQSKESPRQSPRAKTDPDRKPPVSAFDVNADPFLINDDMGRDDWKTYCEGTPAPDLSDCQGREINTRDVLNAESELTQRVEYVLGENGEEISHGITTLYWPEGTKKTQISYVCGVRHGPVFSWHAENGVLWQKAGFCNNRDHGDLLTWSTDGLLQRRFSVEGGMWHGQFTDWYEDGSKRFEVQWVRGKRQGPAIWWDQTGRQHFRIDYIDNVRQP